MKKLFVSILSLVILAAAPAASAQDYSGPDLKAGVFTATNAGPGADVAFQASGLMPGAAVESVLIAGDGSESTLGSTAVKGLSATRLAGSTVGADGTINMVISLPDDLSDGTYTLEVRSTKADGSPFVSSVTFTSGGAIGGGNAAANNEAAAQELALTGSSSSNFLQIAGLSLVLGFGMLAIAKRRSEELETVDA